MPDSPLPLSLVLDGVFVIGFFYVAVALFRNRIPKRPLLSKQNPLWFRAIMICFVAILISLLGLFFLYLYQGTWSANSWLPTVMSGVSLSGSLFMMLAQSKVKQTMTKTNAELRY
jgi:hypothetical protein